MSVNCTVMSRFFTFFSCTFCPFELPYSCHVVPLISFPILHLSHCMPRFPFVCFGTIPLTTPTNTWSTSCTLVYIPLLWSLHSLLDCPAYSCSWTLPSAATLSWSLYTLFCYCLAFATVGHFPLTTVLRLQEVILRLCFEKKRKLHCIVYFDTHLDSPCHL